MPENPATPFFDFESEGVVNVKLMRQLRKDLQEAAKLMELLEVRQIVKSYYDRQDDRKRSASRLGATEQEDKKPSLVLETLLDADERLEAMLYGSLGIFGLEYKVGRWLHSIRGIGAVISAGMLAMLDIRRRPTAGHFYRFAGLVPGVRWLSSDHAKEYVAKLLETSDKRVRSKPVVTEMVVLRAAEGLQRRYDNMLSMTRHYGEGKLTAVALAKAVARRPYHPGLKVLVWKAECCIVRAKSSGESFYGDLYDKRKEWEIAKNERGDNKEWCQMLIARKIVKKSHENYDVYEGGKLIPAHVDARARRWMGKIFLSHLHHVMWEDYYGYPPPMPFAFTKSDGDHRHYIPPPNWPNNELGGKNLRVLLPVIPGDRYLQGPAAPLPKYSSMPAEDFPEGLDQMADIDMSGEVWFDDIQKMMHDWDYPDDA